MDSSAVVFPWLGPDPGLAKQIPAFKGLNIIGGVIRGHPNINVILIKI